jgi:hypothetical protein
MVRASSLFSTSSSFIWLMAVDDTFFDSGENSVTPSSFFGASMIASLLLLPI